MITNGTAGVGKVGFVGIYWPSLWFPDTPATPPKRAGSAQAGSGAVVDLSAGTAAVSGADIAKSLRPGFADQAQQKAVTEIGRLIDEGEAAVGSGESDAAKEQRILQIHQQLQSLLPPPQDGRTVRSRSGHTRVPQPGFRFVAGPSRTSGRNSSSASCFTMAGAARCQRIN